MQHIRFGRTGLQVSRLCLSTMTFGLQCDEKTSHAILDTATEAGITFLDTADVYPLGGKLEDAGRTEEIMGRWLRGGFPLHARHRRQCAKSRAIRIFRLPSICGARKKGSTKGGTDA